jgi:hypothetical protein
LRKVRSRRRTVECCFLPNWSGAEFGKTADNGHRGQLWIGSEPALDQRQVRIERAGNLDAQYADGPPGAMRP